MTTSIGKIRECHRTNNGAVFPSKTEFPEDDLPFLQQQVDKKNRDRSIPAKFWIERFNEDTGEWEPVYP